MNAEAHAAFVEALLRPSKIEQMLNRGITPEQRAAIEQEHLAHVARNQEALSALAAKITPEFLDVLAQAARVFGTTDEGEPIVHVRELFDLAGAEAPNLAAMEFGTPGYVDPRFANKVDFSFQRPSGLPIVRCDDLCGGAAP